MDCVNNMNEREMFFDKDISEIIIQMDGSVCICVAVSVLFFFYSEHDMVHTSTTHLRLLLLITY